MSLFYGASSSFFLNKRMGFYFYFLVNYLFIFGSAGSLFLRVGFL